jgi:hypothetical protein
MMIIITWNRLYVCDPVLGDEHKLYVPRELGSTPINVVYEPKTERTFLVRSRHLPHSSRPICRYHHTESSTIYI